MSARLVIYARWIALVVLVLAIALIIARWKLPVPRRTTRSEGSLDFWRDAWSAWRHRRREATRRSRNIRNLRGRKALIIGPEDKAFRAMRWRLEGLRCAVQSAPTGTRAVAAARKDAPDVIIADALLPDMSAEDLLDSLGQTRAAVIFVGATTSQREALIGRGANVASVGMSFDPDDVAALAGQMLEHLADQTG